jgi:flagellar hook-basal body complex protein FliE
MLDRVLPAGASAAKAADPLAAPAAPGIGAAAPAQPVTADFGAMLSDLVTSTAGSLKSAEAAAIAGTRGQASVQQVVEAVMNAEQTLQSTLAVRDKVVAAYLEISRMQI